MQKKTINNINLNEIDPEILKQLEKKYSKKYSKDDLKEIISEFNLKDLIKEKMPEFEGKTQPIAKKFAKFTKKMNGKDPLTQKTKVINFVKKEVYYFWQKYIENEISFLSEAKEILPEDVYYTYIFGFFVTLHSRALKRDQKINTMANALAEIKLNSNRIKAAMEEYLKLIKEKNNEKK
jgi:hypothetical protein